MTLLHTAQQLSVCGPHLQVPVGYMPFLDSCSAWLMDEQGLRAEYSTQVWSGPAAELEAAAYGAAEQVSRCRGRGHVRSWTTAASFRCADGVVA